MMPCTDYLTNMTVLTPPGQCCDGLKTIIRDAPICLCHGMTGGLNQFLPKPVDHLRMTALPLACGTVLPIQTLFMCNSNQVPPIMPPTTAEPLMTPATP
ncbi:non-specific lipid-transfer protein-like protein At2g13820 [Setaria italica]|nr:non-specific lipid-transfer protein-like protein At2g13820 [Setaria italica]